MLQIRAEFKLKHYVQVLAFKRLKHQTVSFLEHLINIHTAASHLVVNNAFIDQGSGSGSRSEMFRLLHAKNIARPQLKFKEKVDNSNTPFIPKIFIKPNAVKPLPSCKTSLSSSNLLCR